MSTVNGDSAFHTSMAFITLVWFKPLRNRNGATDEPENTTNPSMPTSFLLVSESVSVEVSESNEAEEERHQLSQKLFYNVLGKPLIIPQKRGQNVCLRALSTSASP